ncbi:HAD family hydrolase [Nannocystis bainbridge]|uniref:phosphoglycolate phosphatase n=1 Tax=Nannocystis bainbridge TaxID=2995303 RepID=A0ABT5E1M3_9BACT|nr:HAD-IA family hydrolase [Nannocystis bainbridge]MDC0719770.1 HAD-IA family hydrolase [Nannocystis bainbridge]
MSHLIALDLDGTLEDSRDDMVAAVLRVRAGFGLSERPGAEFLPHVNAGMDHLYRQCFADYVGADGALDEVRAAYEADYLAHIADATRLYPGMGDALVELAALGSLACVTNKPERLSAALLEALGVGRLFSAVIGGDTCPECKPSPRVLVEASRRVGRSGAALMIGDSAADVKCGRAFGATTIWCAWGYAAEPGAEPPDHRAAAPHELPRLVRSLLP